MPKISIIIPIYNVENYLSQCLDSVVNQTLNDIEILCINDGSTDKSLEILKKYAIKDSRIKIIDKINEGAAVARNIGINNATGDYIMFLDSDDMLTPKACEIAYKTITIDNTDIVIFGHKKLFNNTIIEKDKDEHFTSYETNEKISDDLIYIWDKIFKTDFLQKNNIKYLTNCKTSEDIVFCWNCYLNKAKISKITTALYVYRVIRENSATANSRGVASDFYTFKKFEEQKLFQQQPSTIKFKIIERFCGGYNYYYKRNFENKTAQKQIEADMNDFCKYLETRYSKKELYKIKQYRKFKLRNIHKILETIFSITKIPNTKQKIIQIFGLKIKLRMYKK